VWFYIVTDALFASPNCVLYRRATLKALAAIPIERIPNLLILIDLDGQVAFEDAADEAPDEG